MKTYQPYTFDGKNIICYIIEEPKSHLINSDFIYDSQLTIWRNSKITIPVSEECLNELRILLLESIYINSPNDVRNKIKNKESLFQQGIDISELADRILIYKKCEVELSSFCHCDGDCSQYYYKSKLLPIKKQFTINPCDMEDVEYKKIVLAEKLDKYIKDEHTQQECTGFIDGFNKAWRHFNNLTRK